MRQSSDFSLCDLICVYIIFLSTVLGKMRLAVGSAQLLMSQKFQQFRELCEENLVCDSSSSSVSFDPSCSSHKI